MTGTLIRTVASSWLSLLIWMVFATVVTVGAAFGLAAIPDIDLQTDDIYLLLTRDVPAVVAALAMVWVGFAIARDGTADRRTGEPRPPAIAGLARVSLIGVALIAPALGMTQLPRAALLTVGYIAITAPLLALATAMLARGSSTWGMGAALSAAESDPDEFLETAGLTLAAIVLGSVLVAAQVIPPYGGVLVAGLLLAVVGAAAASAISENAGLLTRRERALLAAEERVASARTQREVAATMPAPPAAPLSHPPRRDGSGGDPAAAATASPTWHSETDDGAWQPPAPAIAALNDFDDGSDPPSVADEPAHHPDTSDSPATADDGDAEAELFMFSPRASGQSPPMFDDDLGDAVDAADSASDPDPVVLTWAMTAVGARSSYQEWVWVPADGLLVVYADGGDGAAGISVDVADADGVWAGLPHMGPGLYEASLPVQRGWYNLYVGDPRFDDLEASSAQPVEVYAVLRADDASESGAVADDDDAAAAA